MCGIFAIFNATSMDPIELRKLTIRCAKLLRHRGPDWSGIHRFPDSDAPVPAAQSTPSYQSIKTAILAHERLSIIDPASGSQPLFSNDKKLVLCVNGEIYNHRSIRDDKEFEPFHQFITESDCEIVIPLYKRYGEDAPK